MTETAFAPTPGAPLDTSQQPAPIISPPAVPGAVPLAPPVIPAATPAPLAPAAVDPWAGVEDPELKAFVGTKTPAEVAKELKAAQGLIGKKTVGVPGEGSTPEEQAAFHKARGVPESEAAYKFDDVLSELTAGLPEGLVVMDPAREAETRALFKAANISNGEGRELIRRQLGKEIETRKAELQASKALETKTNDLVTQGWGTKRDEYTQDANNYMRAIGIDEDVLKVMNSALGTNPEARFKFLEMARTQGALLREGGVPNGDPSGLAIQSMTPQQARLAKETYLAQGDNKDIYLGKKSDAKRYAEISAHVAALAKVERGIK